MAKAPKISIITRTKDRPVFLARAAQSLSAQSFQDFEWVVVNDGGDESSIASLIKTSAVGQSQKLINLKTSAGRGGAGQAGLDKARGTYIMFHDDDDALAPDALEKLSAVLDHEPDAVAVTSTYEAVKEELRGGKLVELTRKPSPQSDLPISLSDLAYRNQLLTIGTLFRRDIALDVGGVKDSLPVLEDWDLWLRMAERGDILRVPEVLAYQHIREGRGAQANSNLELHRQVEAKLRNAYLRRDLAEGRQGLGHLMNMQHRETLEEMKGLLGALRRIKRMLFFLQR